MTDNDHDYVTPQRYSDTHCTNMYHHFHTSQFSTLQSNRGRDKENTFSYLPQNQNHLNWKAGN